MRFGELLRALASLTEATGSGPRAELGAREPDDGRHSRQRIAPGFVQNAVTNTPLYVFSRGRDAVADLLSVIAGAMGFETQYRIPLTGAAVLSEQDMEGAARAMMLNSRANIEIISSGLALSLVEQQISLGYRPHLVIEVTGFSSDDVRRLVPVHLSVPRTTYYARTGDGVVLGSDLEAVREQADKEFGYLAMGVESMLAASCLLGDVLAGACAYTPPPPEEPNPMPRTPEVMVLRQDDGGPTDSLRKNICILLVGGGGALAHNFLEAVLVDRDLRQALQGGRIIICDPDSYELSNLSRQTLAAGAHNLGRSKSVVTAETFLKRWQASDAPEVVPVPALFQESMVAEHGSDIVGLFPDNLAARASAWTAALARGPGTMVLFGATEFTFGRARAYVSGSSKCCLDCGPEELCRTAEEERAQEARSGPARNGCGAEITPSNVLTNAIVGALCARELRRFLRTGHVADRGYTVNWGLPERFLAGRDLPACSCWSGDHESA